MIVALALAVAALRAGLALRRARRLGAPGRRELRFRHLQVSKPAVLLLLVGFALGPASMRWLRGQDAFSTFHALLGVLAAALFAFTAVVGRRLERGRGGSAEAHAAAGIAALLAAAAAAVAGFVLLP